MTVKTKPANMRPMNEPIEVIIQKNGQEVHFDFWLRAEGLSERLRAVTVKADVLKNSEEEAPTPFEISLFRAWEQSPRPLGNFRIEVSTEHTLTELTPNLIRWAHPWLRYRNGFYNLLETSKFLKVQTHRSPLVYEYREGLGFVLQMY